MGAPPSFRAWCSNVEWRRAETRIAGDIRLLLHAVGLLCALACATLATAARERRGVLALAGGFALGAFWFQPEARWIGVLVAAAAGLSLARPHGVPASLPASLVAGLAGGLWTRVLAGYGLPAWAAWLAAAAVLAVAASSSRRDPGFAPPALRDDALAAIGALGLAVAAAPAVTAGWRAAAAMNLETDGLVRPGVHPWVVVGVAAMVSLGGLHTLRRRR